MPKRKAAPPKQWDDGEVAEIDVGGGGNCLFYCFAHAIAAGLTSPDEGDQVWARTCQSLVESWYTSNPVLVEMKDQIGAGIMPCSAHGLRALVAWFVVYSDEYKAILTRETFDDPLMRVGIPAWVKRAISKTNIPGVAARDRPIDLEVLRQIMLSSDSKNGYFADYVALSLLVCLLPITAVVVTLTKSTTLVTADEQCTYAETDHPIIVLHNVRAGGYEHYVIYTLSGVPYVWDPAEVQRILTAVKSTGAGSVMKRLMPAPDEN